jgi:hypothetical protein
MPFSFPDPFSQDIFSGTALAAPRVAAPSLTIPQEDVESGIGGLMGSLGGGLEYIGSSLNKAFGGRALRSLLGAAKTGDTSRLRDVLSIIPFSDFLHITDPSQETTGKELAGFDPHDDSWTAFGAGLATDILTDPGTFFNPFGKTLQGIAAAKAGLLPKVVQPITREAGGIGQGLRNVKKLFTNAPANFEGSVAAEMRGIKDAGTAAAVAAKIPGATAADVIDKPLRSLMTFHVPGTDIYHPIGTGATAQNIANNLGSIGDYLAYSPVGRAVSPLFDKRLTNTAVGLAPTTEIGQREARQVASKLSDAQEAVQGEFLKRREAAEALGMTDPARAPLVNEQMTALLEGRPTLGTSPELQRLAGDIRPDYQTARPKAAAVGREAKVYQSDYPLDYTHRQMTKAAEELLGESLGGGKAFKPANAADVARNELLDLPGGEQAINLMFRDPQAALGTHGMGGLGGQGLPKVGPTNVQAQNHILEKYFGWTDTKTNDFWAMKKEAAAGTLTATDPRWKDFQLMQREWNKAKDLPALIASKIEEPFKKGLAAGANPDQLWNDLFTSRPKMFADNPVGLARDYMMGEAASNLGAQGFSNILLGAAKRGANMPGERVSVAELLKNSRYDNENMTKLVIDEFKKSGILTTHETEKALRDVYVPTAVAQDLSRFGRSFQQTRETNPIWKTVDTLANLNKVSQTTLFPFTLPTILRNLLTEGWTNLTHGLHGTGEGLLGNLARPWIAQKELRSGAAAPSLTRLFPGMSADDATRAFRNELSQHGLAVPFGAAEKAELVGRAAHDSGMVGTLGPLAEPQKSIWDMIKSSVTGFGEPGPLSDKLKIRGVAGATETTLPPVKAAQEIMHAADMAGRNAAYYGARAQGYDPKPAAELAKWMRMGAEDLTDWERTWMTRVIPYYRWLRTSIPATLGDIAAHPGGLNAQAIRASNALRENEGFVPDYVGEGLAVPIGERTPEGTQRYLSRFGLPFEELSKLASMSAHPWQRTMQQLGGNLNPLIKNPIEFMTGTQLYSGRHLDDLYNRTGVDQLLGMTPLMTPFRFGSRLADSRKNALATIASLASPATVTDADMNRALIVEGRRLLDSELSASPMIRQFSRPYVPDQFRDQLSPHDQQLLALYNTLRSMAREQFAGGQR